MKALKILLVDDNNRFRNSALRYLDSNLRYEYLVWASSGEEAIEKVETYKPDLIIIDIAMTGMNGLDTTKLIRTKNSTVKIIILTINNDQIYHDKALEAGANAFISKPEFASMVVPKVKEIFS